MSETQGHQWPPLWCSYQVFVMDVWTLKLPMLIFTVSCLKLFTEDIWNPRSPKWIFTVLFANFHEGCLKPQANNAHLHCMFLPLNHQCWSLMCIFLCFHYVFLKPCHHCWLLSWWLCRMNRFLSSIRNDFNYQHHLCQELTENANVPSNLWYKAHLSRQ